MKIKRNIVVPTGNILIVEGEKGLLECLSIADYGKEANVKADFLGLSRNIEQVTHSSLLPLEDKWVVTISTQYGCSMNCTFCDVPRVGRGVNATYEDLMQQIELGLSLHPEVTETERLNIHYARMGEPTWNPEVLRVTENLYDRVKKRFSRVLIHPVLSTMMPKHNLYLKEYLTDWMLLKNGIYGGDAGLQLSINSTSNTERDHMFSGNAVSIEEAGRIGRSLPKPLGRKITLNFAVADYEIDAKKLRELFDPKHFIVKLTPMHKTKTAVENAIETQGDYTTIYPYLETETQLKEQGFDVLVFIASEYEDLGRITCGNAILSGTEPNCPHHDSL